MLVALLIQKVIDYVKMDVEGSEIAAFEAMFESNVLSNVKQIGFELHTTFNNSSEYFYKTWSLLRKLEERGFRLWVLGHNTVNIQKEGSHPALSGLFCCSNLYFININFLKWSIAGKKVN